MRTVTVSGFGTFLGRRSERLVVRKKGTEEEEIPLFRIGDIIIPARGVSLSGELIEAACERGIPITFITSGGKPFALLTSPMLSATVLTRRRQLQALDEEVGAALCRLFVAGKLRNQAGLLTYGAKYLGRKSHEERDALKRLVIDIRTARRRAMTVPGAKPSEVRAALMGIEGAAARSYWSGIDRLLGDGIEFEGRRHRGAHDPVNALLNYGYGILQSKVWSAILGAGLDPFGGFLHVDRSGKPARVHDLMEEFRAPVVDRPVLAYVNQRRRVRFEGRMMDEETRVAIADAVLDRLGSTVMWRGQRVILQSVIQAQARRLAVFLRGEADYRPFTMYW